MKSLSDKLLQELAEKWLNGTLTAEEESLFNEWYEQQSEASITIEAETDDRDEFKNTMFADIRKRAKAFSPKRGLRNIALYGSAAAIIFILIGFWRYTQFENGPRSEAQLISAEDVKPGSNKAILTLANGRTILLDSMKNGTLTSSGGVTVTKADNGLLIYKTTADKNISAGYNILSTPKGGKFKIVLPDGTYVWLNSASSIRYPIAFSGKERKVELTGEAYFEVVHNDKMPFKVQTGNVIVEDVGTHFDINGYSDEPALKVTLLEGLVKVNLPNKSRLLKPGEQAMSDKNGSLQIVRNADADGAVAWKNNLFNFNGADLEGIMRQLKRWYNISVVYAPGVPNYTFGGDTYMNSNLSEVLKVLELSGLHFKTEKDGADGKIKLTVMP